jgi:hypothetical protein
MHFTERREARTFAFQMSLYKELLVDNWSSSANMVETRQSYKTHKEELGNPFCNGYNYHHVLEHLDENQCLNFQ